MQKLINALTVTLVVISAGIPGRAEDRVLPVVVSRVAPVALPAGKTAYTVSLPALPDPGIVGQRADVYVRRVTNDSRVDDYKLLLRNVLVLAIPDSFDGITEGRQATLALDPKEVKKLRKFERIGRDIVVRASSNNI